MRLQSCGYARLQGELTYSGMLPFSCPCVVQMVDVCVCRAYVMDACQQGVELVVFAMFGAAVVWHRSMFCIPWHDLVQAADGLYVRKEFGLRWCSLCRCLRLEPMAIFAVCKLSLFAHVCQLCLGCGSAILFQCTREVCMFQVRRIQ